MTNGRSRISIDSLLLNDPLKAEAKTLLVVFQETEQGLCLDVGQCA